MGAMLVYTIKERCRVCYTCVRECPAKAIRIVGGQAEVIDERCITCGNCTKVCSQNAKVFLKTTDRVQKLLESDSPVAAIVAPSFPAEFPEMDDPGTLVGMIRSLGFDTVSEVSFGADLVAAKYKELTAGNSEKYYISSDCPAIVSYITYYHPNLTKNLAPIVSPMVAMTRVMREKYGRDLKVVFIGPCVAKKAENREVDEAITFTELREMFDAGAISFEKAEAGSFDPPHSGKGAIFPVSRGLLQTAGIDDDATHGNIIAAEGRADFQEAIREFEAGLINDQHLELLCCEGCIMGPGLTSGGKQYKRRALVSNYVRQKMSHFDEKAWQRDMDHYNDIDLSIRHQANDQRIPKPDEEEVLQILRKMGKEEERDMLNCGACGYETCAEHAVAIKEGLAEIEMCLPYTIEKLHNMVNELALSNDKLTTMQLALRQSEKLAHMGQLSAGIAHELNNPLGVVIMYSNILLEECTGEDPLRKDLHLIAEQAGRCKKIVAGLLNFARKNQVNHQNVHLRDLLQQSLESLIIPDSVEVAMEDNTTHGIAQLDSEQMLQVFSNLVKNAIDAMPEGGKISILLEDNLSDVTIRIADTGVGIREEDRAKIFEPFFTTKGIGQGTGLGLATAYGVVKMHKGQIRVESNADSEKGPTGTTFVIALPKNKE